MLTYILKPVKGRKNINYIFGNAFKYYEKDAVIFVCNRETNNGDLNEIREVSFLVAVRKKDAKKAVIRNRIKRLLRESIRMVFKEMSELGKESNIGSLAVVWGRIPERVSQIKLEDVRPVVARLIERSNSEAKTKKQIE